MRSESSYAYWVEIMWHRVSQAGYDRTDASWARLPFGRSCNVETPLNHSNIKSDQHRSRQKRKISRDLTQNDERREVNQSGWYNFEREIPLFLSVREVERNCELISLVPKFSSCMHNQALIGNGAAVHILYHPKSRATWSVRNPFHA